MDGSMIWAMISSKNTSAAFIIPESKAEIILGLDDMVQNGHNLFHIINFNVGKLKKSTF